MKNVFLSHAAKDTWLARELAGQLEKGGLQAWNPDDEIAPGENWAKKVGKALDDSDLMVILLTPKAMGSESLRREIEFAIGSKRYDGRVFTVFVGPTLEAGKDMPWILLKLPHRHVGSASDFAEAVNDIRALDANSDLRPTNA